MVSRSRPVPSHRRTRRQGTIALVLALALVPAMSGCGDMRRTEADQTDADRLSALEHAVPFDAREFGGEWSSDEAEGAGFSVNTLARRAEVRTELEIADVAPGGEQPVFDAARTLLALAVEEGWQPIFAECEADADTRTGDAVRLAAVRDVDDVVAVLILSAHDDTVTVRTTVPFHTESEDAWRRPALTPTCLDGSPVASGRDGEDIDLGPVPIE